MDKCQGQLGSAKLPPIVICLLESVKKSSRNLALDQATQAKIDRTIVDFKCGQALQTSYGASHESANSFARVQLPHHGSTQLSPQSFPPHFNASVATRYQPPRNSSSLIDDLLPDMNPSLSGQGPQPFSPHPIEIDFTSPTFDAYDPSISGDIDSFFDELAFLHGAKKLQNQPQFMQNLGFAPEASMADLLAIQSGQYMPMNPPTFGAEAEGEPLHFPLSEYYDTS